MIKKREGSTHDLGPNIKVKWEKKAASEKPKKNRRIEDWAIKNA